MFTSAGTRIIYDRKFLLDQRNSPLAQTPPAHLPVIPGVTSQNVLRENQKNEANNHVKNHDGKPVKGEEVWKIKRFLSSHNLLTFPLFPLSFQVRMLSLKWTSNKLEPHQQKQNDLALHVPVAWLVETNVVSPHGSHLL